MKKIERKKFPDQAERLDTLRWLRSHDDGMFSFAWTIKSSVKSRVMTLSVSLTEGLYRNRLENPDFTTLRKATC